MLPLKTQQSNTGEHQRLDCISKAFNPHLKRVSNQSKPVLRRCTAWSILGITCLLKAGCQGLAHHTVCEKAKGAGQPSPCAGHGQQKCLQELQEPISSFSRGRDTLSLFSKQCCRNYQQQEPLLPRTHPWPRSWVHGHGHPRSFPFQGSQTWWCG